MKAMKPILMMITAVGITVATLPRAADEEIDTVPATKAALAWLAIVDAGHYGQSWESTAEVFRAGVTKPQWEALITSVRGKVGGVQLRKVTSVQFVRDLPKAPPGEYVVIQYATRFDNGQFNEMVTLMHEKDGSWKVAGY